MKRPILGSRTAEGEGGVSYNYYEHMHIYDAFGKGVCMCLCVCLHDNLKTRSPASAGIANRPLVF